MPMPSHFENFYIRRERLYMPTDIEIGPTDTNRKINFFVPKKKKEKENKLFVWLAFA